MIHQNCRLFLEVRKLKCWKKNLFVNQYIEAKICNINQKKFQISSFLTQLSKWKKSAISYWWNCIFLEVRKWLKIPCNRHILVCIIKSIDSNFFRSLQVGKSWSKIPMYFEKIKISKWQKWHFYFRNQS